MPPDTGDPTPPAGYTEISDTTVGTSRTVIWRRTADGTEQAISVTFVGLGLYNKVLSATVYRNVDPLVPIEAISSGAAPSATAVTAPGVTTTQNLAFGHLVLIGGQQTPSNSTGTWTVPAGMTRRNTTVALPNATVEAGGPTWEGASQLIADQPVTVFGASDTRTATHAPARDLTGTLIALRHAQPPGRYYHHDQLGSTRAITNEWAETVGSYTYDAWGKPTSSAGSIAPTFGYAGQYTDTTTGLNYMRARWYDPTTGQFLTRDPLVATTREAYGYVGGNPINRVDPTGEDWGPIGWAAEQVTPDCFAWQDDCESIISQATNGAVCSRFFDENCSEPIGELKATVCPAYGCVALTYDGRRARTHFGLGMAFNASASFSPTLTSCDPHDEAFLALGPAGVSGTRQDPRGRWSWSGSAGKNPRSPFNWGFGLVHWFN